jgi:hypothetical protein
MVNFDYKFSCYWHYDAFFDHAAQQNYILAVCAHGMNAVVGVEDGGSRNLQNN